MPRRIEWSVDIQPRVAGLLGRTKRRISWKRIPATRRSGDVTEMWEDLTGVWTQSRPEIYWKSWASSSLDHFDVLGWSDSVWFPAVCVIFSHTLHHRWITFWLWSWCASRRLFALVWRGGVPWSSNASVTTWHAQTFICWIWCTPKLELLCISWLIRWQEQRTCPTSWHGLLWTHGRHISEAEAKKTSWHSHCQLDISIFDNFLSFFFCPATLNLDYLVTWICCDLCSLLGQRWSPSSGTCGDAPLAADLGCAKGTQGRTTLILRGSLSAPRQHWSLVMIEVFQDGSILFCKFHGIPNTKIWTSLKLKALLCKLPETLSWTWDVSSPSPVTSQSQLRAQAFPPYAATLRCPGTSHAAPSGEGVPSPTIVVRFQWWF